MSTPSSTLRKIFFAIGTVFIFFSCKESNIQKYTTSFPTPIPISQSKSLSCQALIDGDFTGSSRKNLTNGIEASVYQGSNRVSLQIKDQNTLTFLSGASFDNGDIAGANFTIIKNNEKELVAYMWDTSSINTLVINKNNGLAIWSKTRSEFLMYDAPDAGISYLSCK